jgi:uracil-DNA glycosylase family 4
MRTVDPQSLGCNCEACPFKANNKKTVWGEIPFSPQAVLVCDAPGQDDADAGRPLVGATGREFEATLANAGLRRQDVAIVGATLCKAPSNAEDEDLMKAVKCCKPALTYQFTENKLTKLPRLIMGRMAMYAFYNKTGVENARGFIRDGNVIVTYDPTYAYFRNPYVWGTFDLDMVRFRKLISGTCEPGPTELNITPSVGDLQRLVREANGFLACDIETTSSHPDKHYEGKDPTRAVLKTIGFGIPTWGVSIWWETITPEVETEVKRILLDVNLVKIFHNGYFFDIPVLRRHGFIVANVEDTRDMRRALSATSPLSLRHSTSLYTDYEPWKELEAGADDGEVK